MAAKNKLKSMIKKTTMVNNEVAMFKEEKNLK